MRYPIDNIQNFNITAGNAFGAKVSYGYHSGNDVNGNSGGNTDLGTPIKAIMPGIITSVISQYWGYGNHVHLRFELNGKPYWAHYCHLLSFNVVSGQTVREGDLMGKLGNSGNSTYAHLHFEIKNQPTGVDGIARTTDDLKKWENPWEFIKKNMKIPLTPAQKEQEIRRIYGLPVPPEEHLRLNDIVIHG